MSGVAPSHATRWMAGSLDNRRPVGEDDRLDLDRQLQNIAAADFGAVSPWPLMVTYTPPSCLDLGLRRG